MNIAKIKASLPNFNPDFLRYKCNVTLGFLVKTSKEIDLKSLAMGLGIVAVLYMLIFFYVYMSGASVILKLESKLATETVSIDYKKKISAILVNDVKKRNDSSSVKSILINGLYEDTPMGNLPIIREVDQFTSFRGYQHPFSFGQLTKPVISFMVVDYGLSRERSEAALDLLPPQVSFLLSPYSDLPDEWIKMAQDKGHEVWINMPIQNKATSDAGRNTIFHHASIKKKQKAMYRSLVSTGGYVGVGSYTDETISVVSEDYSNLIDELYARGLGFFEINPNATKTIENKALSMFAPYIKADLEIFKIKGEYNSFETLEAIAHKKGNAIAVIPSYPNTIKNLAVWILKVAQSDYIIAPVSAIYDLPLHKARSTNDKH